MKKCSRCGKEYSDAATVCPDDGELLVAEFTRSRLQRNILVFVVVAILILFCAQLEFFQTLISWVIFFGPWIGLGVITYGHAIRASEKRMGIPFSERKLSGLLAVSYVVTVLTGSVFVSAMGRSSRRISTESECASNLKQIALALLIYSGDHNDTFPPNFICASNELNNPNILICPSDPIHKTIHLEQSPPWNATNISYEFLTPGMREDGVTNRVIVRCPFHGFETWEDGSLHQPQAKK
jgi:hypothetical protein